MSEFRINQQSQGAAPNGVKVNSTPLAFRGDGTEMIVLGGETRSACTYGADGFRMIYINGSPEPTNKGGLYLQDALTINNATLTMTSGKLYLGTGDLALQGSASISGANTSRYVVSNGSVNGGRLSANVSAAELLFPLGVDFNYTPVAISQGGNQRYRVGVFTGVLDNVATGSFVDQNTVDRTWMISPTTPQTGVGLKFTWNAGASSTIGSNERPGFVRANAKLFGTDGAAWGTELGTVAPTGSDPYTLALTGLSLNPAMYFHVASGPLVTADRTWNGSVSSIWTNPNNWTPAEVPTAFSRVTIPNGVPNNPLITTGNHEILSLAIRGGTLGISGGQLAVNGEWRTQGTFNHTGGRVVLQGALPSSVIGANTFAELRIANANGVTLPNQTTTANTLTLASNGRLHFSVDSASTTLALTGTWDNSANGILDQKAGQIQLVGTTQQTLRGKTTFLNLVLNNPAGAALAETDTVTGTLSLTQGQLVLGAFDLVLKGASATISGGSASSYVRTSTSNGGGALKRLVGASEVLFPIGTSTYTPARVTGGNNRMHTVRVFDGLQSQATAGTAITERAVNRTWFISPDYSTESFLLDVPGATAVTYINNLSDGINTSPTTNWTNDNPYGGVCWSVNNNNGAIRDSVRIMPTFATSGTYEIFIYYPSNSNFGGAVYHVLHKNGVTLVPVNQRVNGNSWVSLGSFEFDAGQSASRGAIKLWANTGGSFCFVDAFRFDFRSPSGASSTVKFAWNAADEQPLFNASRAKVAVNIGGGTNWRFQPNISVVGREATSTGVTENPYFAVGGWGDNTWIGGVDSLWGNPQNWSIGVPTADEDVTIPSTVASGRGPKVVSGDNLSCRSLTLQGGNNGRLRISGGVLTIHGAFTNNGVGFFHTNGKVILAGTSSAVLTGTNTFHKLEIRNAGGLSFPSGTTRINDSLIVRNTGRALINSGTVTVMGHLRLMHGTSILTMNGGVLSVRGNWDNSAQGQFQVFPTAGQVELAGTTAQEVYGKNRFRNLVIRNTSPGGVSLPNDSTIVLRDLSIGTNARLTQSAGHLVVRNNLSNLGTFSATGGWVTFDGTGAQALAGSLNFTNLRINKSAGSFAFASGLNQVQGELLISRSANIIPVDAGQTLSIGDKLTLNADGKLALNGGRIRLQRDFDNAAGGFFSHASGTFQFVGGSKSRILGDVTFHRLELNKTQTGADTLLVNNITVLDSLNLVRGIIQTGRNGLLTLSTVASVSNETDVCRVVGRMRQAKATTASPSNWTGMGLSINPGTQDLGLVTVTRTSGLGQSGTSFVESPILPGAKGIDVIWRIEPAQQPSTDPVDVSFSWLAATDNGNSVLIPWKAYKRSAPYTGNFLRVPGTFAGTGRSVTVSTGSFSEWTLSDLNNPLPIVLTRLSATYNAEKDQVDLNWETASETNNDRFEVERSLDFREFSTIGAVKGAGTTVIPQNYSFVDTKPVGPVLYYRLKQVDGDGKYAYSYIVSVRLEKAQILTLNLYPNPASEGVAVRCEGLSGIEAEVSLVDMLGRTVKRKSWSVKGGKVEGLVPLDGLSAGSYTVKVRTAEQQLTQLLEIKR